MFLAVRHGPKSPLVSGTTSARLLLEPKLRVECYGLFQVARTLDIPCRVSINGRCRPVHLLPGRPHTFDTINVVQPRESELSLHSKSIKMALVASGRVTVEGGPIAPARAWRNPRALLVFVVTALAVSAAHLQYMHLPYYWDEAGQFIPAASDIFRHGEWIPSSTVPNIHPPAIPAYVSLAWKVAGDSVVTTRVAMLLLAAVCLWGTWLLGTELLPHKRRAGWLAVLLLLVSPLFFVQSMLAQLDLRPPPLPCSRSTAFCADALRSPRQSASFWCW